VKRNMVFGVLLLVVFVLQAQALFAADYNADFAKALSKNNLTKAEDILRKRSAKMDLALLLERVILNNIKGFDSNNAINVAQMLIRYGAIVNAIKRVNLRNDNYYEAPLLYINVFSGGLNKEQTVEMINLLCRSGANPDAPNRSGTAGYTPLMAACLYNSSDLRIAIVNALVENKADVNARNKLGETALIVAAQEERTDVVTFLIKHGANVNLRDNNGLTAASICYDKGQIDMYNYLKANGAIDFEPRQVTQQSAAPPPSYSPPPSSSGGSSSSQPSAPATPVLQAGTYACSGTNHTMTLIRITDTSGTVTYYVGGSPVGFGTYSIRNNQFMFSFTSLSYDGLKGKSFIYTVTSATSFSGSGENWGKR